MDIVWRRDWLPARSRPDAHILLGETYKINYGLGNTGKKTQRGYDKSKGEEGGLLIKYLYCTTW